MTSVKLEDVSFWYPVFDASGRSLKISLMRQFGGNGEKGIVEVRALSQISLEIKHGDRVGLVGRNGAGKSTLLKVLARLIYPQRGGVSIEGRVVPILSRGLGIQPEFSGYRNIELPMRLLGATSAEIRRAQEEVPDWSGLGDFMHLPVRTYSDGMRARLMFALCTAVRGEILVMDEWLSAGDADFVERAQQRLRGLVESTPIVVLSSHSLDIIRKICNVVVWMEEGEIVQVGSPEDVLSAYLKGLPSLANKPRIVSG